MIIKIKLDYPYICEGCPFLKGGVECSYYKEDLGLNEWGEAIRPKKCILENSI